MPQRTQSLQPLPFQTPAEELANAILHGLGALLALAGLALLVAKGAGGFGFEANTWLIVSGALYGATMFTMFISSTLYHAVSHEGAKQVLRILDHGAIYLLIAGTYTPFCLVAMRGPWGWALFGFEWGLAILGIILYATGVKALKKVEVAVYILMGWAIVMGWKPLVEAVNRTSITLLIIGGLAYTAGTLWYRMKARRGTHVAWHAFVLAGAITHWFAIFFM